MARKSAGLLLFRNSNDNLQFFLVHPGGPYFAGKDLGVWSIPKGEFEEDEDPLFAAKREFKEETGQSINGDFIKLTPIKQKGGKIVHAWAVEGDIDHETIFSNTFRMEYPYKSGKWITIPEVDKAAWLDTNDALLKINGAQIKLIEELVEILNKM